MALAALLMSVLALLASGFAYWRQVKWARIAGRGQVRIAAIEGQRHTTALLERMRAALSVIRWIEGWYNPRRLHSSLAYMTPNEKEAAWHTDRLAA